MLEKNTTFEQLKKIYWISHFLFFCGAILLVVFAKSFNLLEIDTVFSYNIIMLGSFSCFFLLNYLFNKICTEGFSLTNKYTYRILYAFIIMLFTLSYASVFNVDMHNLIYVVPIVLISLTCGPYLGIAAILSIVAHSVIYNYTLAFEDISILFGFLIIAWIVGQISDSNRVYALKLARERDFLKDLIETFSEGIIISDSLGRIILCNKQVEVLFTKKENELIGHGEAILWQNYSVPYHKWKPNFINMEIQNRGNTYIISRFILNYQTQESSCFVTVINDITELQQQKKKMQRLATLSAIGELAAGAAHEIRNPLTTVRGFLQLLQIKGETDKFNNIYNIASQELDRVDVIITNMLELAKPQKEDMRSININELINNIWDLYTYSGYLKGIKYDKSLDDRVLPFKGNDQQIKQLLLNIMQNAERACDCNDTISIKTYSDDNNSFVEILDTGKGITPKILKNIMHPFFTTEANGTGLGLAICNRIMADHNGEIKVTSDVGVGTKFTLIFPATRIKREPRSLGS